MGAVCDSAPAFVNGGALSVTQQCAYSVVMTTLDIISDPICPWCFIGKRRLDAALVARPGTALAIRWRPFQLNPEMPPGGMDRARYLAAKFGGLERAGEVYARVAEAAAQDMLAIDLARIARTPNTLDAHRALRMARAAGRDHALADVLFVRYFQSGEDIGDHDVLAAAAVEAGLDEGEARAMLSGHAGRDASLAEDAEARALGVSGVPAFVIDGRHLFSGAQPTAFWLHAIDAVSETSMVREA